MSGSTLFQDWAKRLRLAWNGVVSQRILGGFAAVLGDRSLDEAQQANFEHLPELATDPISVGLIASERQIEPGPTETQAHLAARLTGAVPTWRFAGTAAGLLIALEGAELGSAVLVQQNGRAYQVVAPDAVYTSPWSQVDLGLEDWILLIAELSPNPAIGGIRPLAAGVHGWWIFDDGLDANDDQFCSRFAIIYPDGCPSDLSVASNLERLCRVVRAWRPGKATFVHAVDVEDGWLFDWPKRDFSGGYTFGDHEGTSTIYTC